MLSARLAALQGEVDVSDLAQPDSSERLARRLAASANLPRDHVEPDYLELNHTRKNPNNLRFNISMDYAELFNFGEAVTDRAWLARISANLKNGTVGIPDSGADPGLLNGTDLGGRRMPFESEPKYYYHSLLDSNLHLLEAMKQNVYMIQGRLLDIEHVIDKYEHDVRFRIAYIFNRIDDWFHDLRTVYFSMAKPGKRLRTLLLYYEHVLRKNIDITYSLELIVYLHNVFMAKMNEIMPKEQRDAMKAMNANKQSLGSLNQSAIDFIKQNFSKERKNEVQRRFARLPRL